jgi:hypothetical protein
MLDFILNFLTLISQHFYWGLIILVVFYVLTRGMKWKLENRGGIQLRHGKIEMLLKVIKFSIFFWIFWPLLLVLIVAFIGYAGSGGPNINPGGT